MSIPTRESVLDVGVIGAGPSGLVLAKQLADTGATFSVFERHRDVGGIWDIDAPGSPMYETAHFISSKTLSGFAGFPMPEEYPDYPDHRQILAYIKSFADAHDLRRHIEFDNGVDQAKTDADGLWVLQMSDGTERRCRYLVCANGVTWEPNEVTWPGQETFTGEIRHSNTYRDPAEFAGKRVLIVGAGNSGVDIACDASFAADQAFLSVRRGYHFIPKFIGSTPLDVFATSGPKLPEFIQKRVFKYLLRAITGDLTKYGLPKPDHDLLESHPLMNTQILHYLGHGDCIARGDVERFDGDDVVFADGSREQIDLVISATGYHHKSAFLAEDVFEMKDGRPDLYLRMLPRNHDNLAVLGFIEFASAAYENFDRMAKVIVADATAAADSPRRRDVRRRRSSHFPDLAGSHSYVSSPRHANYVDVETFHDVLDDVTSEITALAG